MTQVDKEAVKKLSPTNEAIIKAILDLIVALISNQSDKVRTSQNFEN